MHKKFLQTSALYVMMISLVIGLVDTSPAVGMNEDDDATLPVGVRIERANKELNDVAVEVSKRVLPRIRGEVFGSLMQANLKCVKATDPLSTDPLSLMGCLAYTNAWELASGEIRAASLKKGIERAQNDPDLAAARARYLSRVNKMTVRPEPLSGMEILEKMVPRDPNDPITARDWRKFDPLKWAVDHGGFK